MKTFYHKFNCLLTNLNELSIILINSTECSPRDLKQQLILELSEQVSSQHEELERVKRALRLEYIFSFFFSFSSNISSFPSSSFSFSFSFSFSSYSSSAFWAAAPEGTGGDASPVQ